MSLPSPMVNYRPLGLYHPIPVPVSSSIKKRLAYMAPSRQKSYEDPERNLCVRRLPLLKVDFKPLDGTNPILILIDPLKKLVMGARRLNTDTMLHNRHGEAIGCTPALDRLKDKLKSLTLEKPVFKLPDDPHLAALTERLRAYYAQKRDLMERLTAIAEVQEGLERPADQPIPGKVDIPVTDELLQPLINRIAGQKDPYRNPQEDLEVAYVELTNVDFVPEGERQGLSVVLDTYKGNLLGARTYEGNEQNLFEAKEMLEGKISQVKQNSD